MLARSSYQCGDQLTLVRLVTYYHKLLCLGILREKVAQRPQITTRRQQLAGVIGCGMHRLLDEIGGFLGPGQRTGNERIEFYIQTANALRDFSHLLAASVGKWAFPVVTSPLITLG